MKKAILLLLMSTSILLSCSKDDDDTPAVKTKAEMIAQTWEIQTGAIGLGAIPPTTGYTKGTPGYLVDMSKFRLQFKNDGTFVQTSLDGTSTTGTWALSENDTKLTLTTAQIPTPDSWRIDNLTEKNLDISRDIAGDSTAPGDLYWKNLIDNFGVPGFTSANGVKIVVKTIPVQ
ncbi:hypothetical protein LX87_04992 [Larkinella arboricola]|uniref:Lipocalin-like protein n=1 Tax=Larkinella arboricola TaxID=643671 RepID=A0A327WQ99_LARAB|nr:hypothetical protein [Larkinella arboricola]RAJ92662.1 hypothetical protein LX87_04992 [Larkinella arboricola]